MRTQHWYCLVVCFSSLSIFDIVKCKCWWICLILLKGCNNQTVPKRVGAFTAPLVESLCFCPTSLTSVLMISLIVADLISQQYLVLVCLSDEPLFNHAHAPICRLLLQWIPVRVYVDNLVFLSNFLVSEGRLFPLPWEVLCSAPGVSGCQGASVFLVAALHLNYGSPEAPEHDPSSLSPLGLG